MRIRTPTGWRNKFKEHTEKQLGSKKCKVRIEMPNKISEGCFLRELVEHGEKDVRFKTSQQNEKNTKKLDSIDAMAKSIFKEDCLQPAEYANNNEGSLFPPDFNECNVDKLDILLQTSDLGLWRV